MYNLLANQAIMTECTQGKPDKDDNPRVYIKLNCQGNEMTMMAYGQVADFKQEMLPLNYELLLSTRVYGNDTSLVIEQMHVDDPFKLLQYYQKATGDGK